jgi:hypothetical protein
MGFCIERLRFGLDLHYDIWDWKTTLVFGITEVCLDSLLDEGDGDGKYG